MQKLYLKIVVAIWTVMILSAVVAITVLRATPNAGASDTFGSMSPSDLLANLVKAGSFQTQGRGEAAFVNWFRENTMFGSRLFVTITRADGELVYESAAGGRSAVAHLPRTALEPVTVRRIEGEYQVRVVPAATFGLQRSIVRAAFQPQLLWLLLLIAIPLSVLLSVLVARYLVSPLRVFERAGARLARGDLQARVAPELGYRGDEIAEFASTFDRMAQKIEGLVKAHQRLLRDVSHELRTPLARVLAAASLARSAAEESSAPEFDRIEQEVGRLDGMISRLLTYAELDADEACINAVNVSLDRLVADIVEESRIEADADDRYIKLDIVSPCPVMGDAELLKSCIENVLRNALRYTPQHGRVEIVLRRTRLACELTLRDYGPGVPGEDLPHLFKPFYQTDTARAPQSGGYGIGLAIAHKAISLHKGWIEAENAEGGGLLVRITLPLAG
ncbi:MAG: ATP-binding protein [Pseudomonadota bacterium]